MSEEPLGVAQERAFAFHTPQLLEEGKWDALPNPRVALLPRSVERRGD